MEFVDRLRHWSSPGSDDAQELEQRRHALGATSIAQAPDRESVDVGGVVRSLTHPPASVGPLELVVSLYDGTGALDVVWLGRRAIPGIRPGVHLRVQGRITYRAGVRTMFNPRYELLPTD
ncbi:OB-fold nucleic acid binding domain-containing protein [Mobilicoccus massiliensis]|uniref:OB-fold nucleic acid binding domain-containing protein n=1 Tax=Mobilicoccus massiliensis TaxID=1522310 RepID=UPI00058FB0CF|nr:OB-fold nucleic acid binding domain-containing protein [Mobilicoccus massiliensis]